ncbi:MAG: Hsp33 family molecular chaperone HslO [Marinobacter sp.]|uniref:Hsp33 family molecular chaperone HslO n=1 Tax=Marinobacter sp. TaxID=50741 RepID=UPI00299D3487|nr:Hsp33 family molecular chaperone HslO [Marinobacter sp.]MDX1636189.1 Hsp33 family molecular chaperone HslO [Marinobacter sp.]
MASQDQFQRFIFEDSQVRGAWVRLADSYREIASQASYPTVVRQLLGESLAASVLMSGTLKFEGTLSLQASGQGPLRTLMTECSHDRYLRGLARFDEIPADADSLGELLGEGKMAITITPEQGQRYQGVVPREHESLARCLEDYFERSEQIATSLVLFADQDQSAGLLLQRLPGGTEPDDDLWRRVNHLASTLKADELLGLDSETVLHRLFHEETVRLFDADPVAFRCSCSRERTLGALEAIGQKECYDIIEERGAIDMDCQFCHAHYRFDRNDIDQLFLGHSLH